MARSKMGQLLQSADLIIWNEVPMQHCYCFEIVHHLLCDLRSSDKLFGGVPFVLGGDFAQTLPVIPRGSRADIVCACLQHSFIWPKLEILRLRQNMRLQSGPDNLAFATWLSQLSYQPELIGRIELPSYIRRAQGKDGLCEQVFPAAELTNPDRPADFFSKRAILCTRNTETYEFNNMILNRMPGDFEDYHAVNSANMDDAGRGQEEFAREFLQSVQLPGLPPSHLRLKVGVPVMLLRNLRPSEGLCNGTRLVITRLTRRLVEARILTGEWKGTVHVLPCIQLQSTETELPFILTRQQFPIRVCFAMTINKSQGQSLDTVGVDLRMPVFTHGQFYVALSRVTNVANLTVLLPANGDGKTDNVVYPEVLEGL